MLISLFKHSVRPLLCKRASCGESSFKTPIKHHLFCYVTVLPGQIGVFLDSLRQIFSVRITAIYPLLVLETRGVFCAFVIKCYPLLVLEARRVFGVVVNKLSTQCSISNWYSTKIANDECWRNCLQVLTWGDNRGQSRRKYRALLLVPYFLPTVARELLIFRVSIPRQN